MKGFFRLLLPLFIVRLGIAAALSDAPGPSAVETVASVSLHDAKRGKNLDTLVRGPKGDGKFPLIFFSHGFGANKEAFAPVSEHWASHGFIVIHPQHVDGEHPIPPPSSLGSRFWLKVLLAKPSCRYFLGEKTS
jgi:hypothetical protein